MTHPKTKYLYYNLLKEYYAKIEDPITIYKKYKSNYSIEQVTEATEMYNKKRKF